MALNDVPSVKLTPSAEKVQLPTNYVSYYDFSSQFIPDTHEEMACTYGNQSIAGMLYMFGNESGMSADKTIWTEEGRLHTVYKDVSRTGNVFSKANHNFRNNEILMISDGSTTRKVLVTANDDNTFTVAAYKNAGLSGFATTNITAFSIGSEFRKGTSGMKGSLESDFTVLENKPIILKDVFEVSGSDATNIGWIKTPQGYYWYMKSEMDTRRRWEDRLELAMIFGEKADVGSEADAKGFTGTEGLIEAVETRGNVFQGIPDELTDWDTILKRFDAQGKIQDYMGYVDRDFSLGVDNMLGTLNAGYNGGVSYGIFQNSEQMAVNLGFRGFKRGTYNFFKTDWKLLNDPTLIGAIPAAAGKVRGLLIPVGTKEVYDGVYNGVSGGQKITTPFLEQKYKVGPNENRKYKTWVLGTVGGVHTNDNDNMEVHHLSERLLKTVGANNFMVFKGN
jgi:hypothetical protein